MEDIQFSNGTIIPAGTHLAVASVPMHLDDRYYENASEFDAFRFLTDAGEESSQKSRLASTNRLYLVFGHGNRAWYVDKEPPSRHSISDFVQSWAFLCFYHDDRNDGPLGIKLRDETEGRSTASRSVVPNELFTQPSSGDHVQATLVTNFYLNKVISYSYS